MRRVVVFPQPEGPKRTTNSPRFNRERHAIHSNYLSESFGYTTQIDKAHQYPPPWLCPPSLRMAHTPITLITTRTTVIALANCTNPCS